MLEKEYKYFVENKSFLFEKYPNKFIVLVGEDVKASFDTIDEAYAYAIQNYDAGTFLIDQCTGEITPQVFHSRVSFV